MIFTSIFTSIVTVLLYQNGQTKQVEFFQHWSQQATSCPNLHCLVGQIQIQQPTIVVVIWCLIKLRLESSIISIDNNFTNNIIRKVINVWLEKIRTKNGTLRNSSSNWIVLWRLPIQIFCYFTSMTFLMLFVILISMLMMLHSTLSVSRLLIHGNN